MEQLHAKMTITGDTIADIQESLADSLVTNLDGIEIVATASTDVSTKIEITGYGAIELSLDEAGLVSIGIHNEDQVDPTMVETVCTIGTGVCDLIVISNDDALVIYFNGNEEDIINNKWAGVMLGTAVSTIDQTETPCGFIISAETSENVDYSYNDFVEIQSVYLPETDVNVDIISPTSTGEINSVNMAPCILTGLTQSIKGCYASSEGIVGAIQDSEENIYYCFGLLAMKISD